MTTTRRPALIAAGYVLAVCGGFAAVAVNERFMPADIAKTSPGMVAFGDMILLVLVAGSLSLVPSWFLLKQFVETASRTLVVIILATSVIGPASWLAAIYLVGGPDPATSPLAGKPVLGLLIAFVAIPRIVFGPVMVVIEGAAFFLIRDRAARVLLAIALLMDFIPLGLYALHLARMPQY
jgi:hypothetical protein